MDNFFVIRKKLFKRYRKYLPLSLYINTSDGLKMSFKLFKVNLEFIIDSDDDYEKTHKKIDTMIVFKKNFIKTQYCSCGVNYNTYRGYTDCNNCGLETCIVCYFRSFKDGQGCLRCYKCYQKTGKRFTNDELFEKYFKKNLQEYISELNDERLNKVIL